MFILKLNFVIHVSVGPYSPIATLRTSGPVQCLTGVCVGKPRLILPWDLSRSMHGNPTKLETILAPLGTYLVGVVNNCGQFS